MKVSDLCRLSTADDVSPPQFYRRFCWTPEDTTPKRRGICSHSCPCKFCLSCYLELEENIDVNHRIQKHEWNIDKENIETRRSLVRARVAYLRQRLSNFAGPWRTFGGRGSRNPKAFFPDRLLRQIIMMMTILIMIESLLRRNRQQRPMENNCPETSTETD